MNRYILPKPGLVYVAISAAFLIVGFMLSLGWHGAGGRTSDVITETGDDSVLKIAAGVDRVVQPTNTSPEDEHQHDHGRNPLEVGGWGLNSIGPITDVVNFVDVLVEVEVTGVTSATFNTVDGELPTTLDGEDIASIMQQLGFREVTAAVTETLKTTSAYSDITGVVLPERAYIFNDTVEESRFLPVGTRGMLGLVVFSDGVLSAPEPFMERVIAKAASETTSGEKYYPLSRMYWFEYDGDIVRHKLSGEEWDLVEFRATVHSALQP